MKKSLALLCMLACILGLTACGSANKLSEESTQSVTDFAENLIEEFNTVYTYGYSAEDYSGLMLQYGNSEEMTAIMAEGYSSYVAAIPEVGDNIALSSEKVTKVTSNDKEAVVTVYYQGSERKGELEVVIQVQDGVPVIPSTITSTVKYSTKELMTKAGLNTLIGMGTVFIVLILISFIISAFALIPKIQDSMAAKKAAKKDIKTEAIDNTIAQIVQKEELSDDLELVAVIAAAIAASEGAASTDGFVVRSIRRRA